jgi:hypothetical protein
MKRIICLLVPLLTAHALFAADSLFYLEAQGVIGYSSEDDKAIYRSGSPQDVMQLNSIGFDFLKKFSGEAGDAGTLALQARLAYNAEDNKAEPQIYNAYLKAKTPLGDIWAGHDRVAFGLASFWDTHGDLLQPLPMYGFGYDRDWGMGLSKDFARGDIKAALSSGTGMGISLDGNWLVTSRGSFGVLSYDNYNIGLSLMGGRRPDTMGAMIEPERKYILLGGLDFSFNHNNFEHKAEINAGWKTDTMLYAGFYRIGLNLMAENRLKLEGQYAYTRQSNDNSGDHAAGAGISYKLTSDLTLRSLYEWQYRSDDHRVVIQFYYYGALL